ncbi:NUDIX hydrolase [Beutenbergia cavernae DSM 12333]|uniref:NAD(+) diphosphatase n=1 Tax=Beutenbergia cavernae (strain ATCC BAA-8 / DSM 12333 / CCUG 43141 / JCM 11478 / NBRC 16432 / NCIMB 13614 / HKI 0122) TaxID=471853 RepID=C5BZ29_BEUC1|nr:NAD(+) diphosphatase [Beutenbergia cavernae]ACQ81144.1 NUDIX hydrolase [Beutenbergia cavernae DSM 12333]
MLEQLPLARSTVDRDAAARVRPDLLTESWGAAGTRVVLVHRARLAAAVDGLDLTAAADLDLEPPTTGTLHYLGRDESGAYLSWVLPDDVAREADLEGVPVHPEARLVAAATWRGLREIGDTLPARDAGLATAAVALAEWRERHVRCPRCGESTQLVEAGWVAQCVADGSLHYPRTDAAVIMTVQDAAGRLLLGHAAHWPERRFSTLAGYVEPGENLEAAVRREVAEEVGLVVDRVTYRGSQPWPFPASLMVGFDAWLGDGVPDIVQVDGVELTEARWFTPDELAADVAAGRVLLPPRSSIALALIEEWFGGPLAP